MFSLQILNIVSIIDIKSVKAIYGYKTMCCFFQLIHLHISAWGCIFSTQPSRHMNRVNEKKENRPYFLFILYTTAVTFSALQLFHTLFKIILLLFFGTMVIARKMTVYVYWPQSYLSLTFFVWSNICHYIHV